MASRQIEVVWLSPGPRARQQFLASRLAGETWVTAYSDVVLRSARSMVDVPCGDWVPWGDLTGRLLSCAGEPALRLPRKGQSLAAIERACRELPPDSPFAACAEFPGLHRRVLSAIDELRETGISPGEVARIDPKLASLAEVEARMIELFEPLGLAPWTWRAERATMLAPARLPFSQLLVLGGARPYPLRSEVLRWIARCGVRVVVGLEPGPRAGEAARLLREHASEPAPIRAWYGPAFGGSPSEEPRPAVEMRSMPDPLGECEWTLRRVLELVADGEHRRRMGLLIPDLATYAPLLASAASRLGVPLDMRQPSPLLTNGAARAVLALLEATASGDPRRLGRALTAGYFRVPPDVSRRVAALGSGEAGWRRLSEPIPGAPRWLARVAEWRESVVREEASFRRWIERLMALVVATPLEESFADPSSPTRERDQRAIGALQRALNDHVVTASARSMGLLEFARRCRRLWEEEQTVLPGSSSGVPVETDPDGFGELDTLFTLSALEGVLTPMRRQDPILDDDLVARVNSTRPGRPPLPDSVARREDESFRLVRLCATAERRLVFSFAKTNADRDNVPAFFLNDLERALGDHVRREDLPRSLFVPPRERCFSPSDRSIRNALDEEAQRISRPRLVEEAARTLVRIEADRQVDGGGEEYWEVREPVRIREIVDASDCAFRAVFRHRLRLRARRTGETWSNVHRLGRYLELAAVPDRDLQTNPPPFEPAFEKLLADYPAEREDWELGLLRANALRVYRGLIEREREARVHWNIEAGSNQGPGSLAPDGGRLIRLPEKRRVRLEGRHDGAARIGRYDVVYLFESGMPEQRDLTADRGLSQARGKTLWTWLSAVARKQPNQPLALMIDDVKNARRSLLLWPRVDAVAPRPNGSLAVWEFAGSGKDLEGARTAVSMALERLMDGRAMPTPGDACGLCPYGELCRSSQDFGEVEPDPFLVAIEGGGEDDG